MQLNIDTFVEHPGKRFPIDISLDAKRATEMSENVTFIEEVRVSGDAYVQFTTLYLDTEIYTVVEQPCRRCLEPVQEEVNLSERFMINISEGESSIDLVSRILGFITAAIDPHPLCRSDCRGLCPICGVNLNEHPNHVCQEKNDDHVHLRDFLK
ncbi:MAG: DUF177 domain-containing protein [Candidatus Bipolaricaulota bacterium]|nr:DUF177 domain-containing protein [Candidatus Bipolaricaulota bacterium]